MQSITSKDRWTIILIAIIVIMGIEIVYLMYQNQRLKAIIEDPKKYFKTLSPDDIVPSFTVIDINGNNISLKYSPEAPRTMLFWFAPGCSPCEGNMDFWNRIYREYPNSNDIRYLGFCAGTPGEAREYVSQYEIEFPVICASDPYIVETYKGNVLPQTVLISSEGAILEIWPGGLQEDQKNGIISRLAQP